MKTQLLFTAPKRRDTTWKGHTGKATRRQRYQRGKWGVLFGLMFILCGCSSQGSSSQAPGICFLSLSLTVFLREEDPVPDRPAGPFPVLKPSLILSTPLAPQPPKVGDEPDRKKRESQVCSIPCYSRLFLPAYYT